MFQRVMQLQHYVKLDISLEEVIAFGDSLNDQSMLEVVGHAVAMGNASDELKILRMK